MFCSSPEEQRRSIVTLNLPLKTAAEVHLHPFSQYSWHRAQGDEIGVQRAESLKSQRVLMYLKVGLTLIHGGK